MLRLRALSLGGPGGGVRGTPTEVVVTGGRPAVREREVERGSFCGSLGKGEVGLGVAGIGRPTADLDPEYFRIPNEIEVAEQ